MVAFFFVAVLAILGFLLSPAPTVSAARGIITEGVPDDSIPSEMRFVEPNVLATNSAQTSAGIAVRF
jgi:hypothetical protein